MVTILGCKLSELGCVGDSEDDLRLNGCTFSVCAGEKAGGPFSTGACRFS